MNFAQKLAAKVNSIPATGFYIRRGCYATGIDVIDFMNGRSETGGNFSIGLSGGKEAYFCGASGSGKTTAAIQAGLAIIEPFPEEGVMFIFDAEKGTTHQRVAALLAIEYEEYVQKYEETRVIIRNSGTTLDGLFALVKEIYRMKLEECGVVFTTPGKTDKVGEEGVKKSVKGCAPALEGLPPTVVVVDSLAILTEMAAAETDSAGSDMDAPREAKALNRKWKMFVQMLYDANIVLICVNHISKGIRNPQRAQVDVRTLKFLKEDEVLPGGKNPAFMADFLVRMEQGGDLSPDEPADMGVQGFICKVRLCKSRSQASGHTLNIVFDQYRGLVNHLSNVLLLKDCEDEEFGLELRGSKYRLPGFDSTFYLKEVPGLHTESDEFRTVLRQNAQGYLLKFLAKMAGRDLDGVERAAAEALAKDD